MYNEFDNIWKNKQMLNDVRKGQPLNFHSIYKKNSFKFQNGGMN